MLTWLKKYSQAQFIQVYWDDEHWWDVIDKNKLENQIQNKKFRFKHEIANLSGKITYSVEVECVISQLLENKEVKDIVTFDYTHPEIHAANRDAEIHFGKLVLKFNNASRTYIHNIDWIGKDKPSNTPRSNWEAEWLLDNPDLPIAELADLKDTVREAIILARTKQGAFRSKLIEVFQGRCPITQIDEREYLVASHIQPWSKSNNQQRIDPNNGLLLSVHYDRLFDRGFISFDSSGKISISKYLDKRILEILGIQGSIKIDLSKSREEYMNYHRKNIFRN